MGKLDFIIRHSQRFSHFIQRNDNEFITEIRVQLNWHDEAIQFTSYDHIIGYDSDKRISMAINTIYQKLYFEDKAFQKLADETFNTSLHSNQTGK